MKNSNKKVQGESSKKKTIAVIDASGRGAVLVHKYSVSPHVGKIIAIPGNDLMSFNSKVPVITYQHLTTTSVKEIVKICKKEKVDLVDVNQDNAVEAGVTDVLLKENINVVGPTRMAGQIEWDKAWSRDFMKKYHLPIPAYKVCHSPKEGVAFIKKQKDRKWFIKAAGLAYGKGALPAENNKKAIDRIYEMKKFGEGGRTFVIEEWLEGEEFTTHALCDGKTYKIVKSAQDHKRMYNWDMGENTGGVGCVSPPLIITSKVAKDIDTIFKKTIDGLKKEGRPFNGILYLGGILVKGKPFVIEFNARWGSPEAEVIVPAIKTDLYKVSEMMSKIKLKSIKVTLDKLTRVAVTISLRENPTGKLGKYGRRIYGIIEASRIKGVTLYRARVIIADRKYYAGSGRILHVVGQGTNVIEAREKAYQAASLISIEGNNQHYRTDIGWRDVERLRLKSK